MKDRWRHAFQVSIQDALLQCRLQRHALIQWLVKAASYQPKVKQIIYESFETGFVVVGALGKGALDHWRSFIAWAQKLCFGTIGAHLGGHWKQGALLGAHKHFTVSSNHHAIWVLCTQVYHTVALSIAGLDTCPNNMSECIGRGIVKLSHVPLRCGFWS